MLIRNMEPLKILLFLSVAWICATMSSAGISPVHDLKAKVMGAKPAGTTDLKFVASPHKVIQHLDNSIQKATKNVTQNPKMEETLYQISKDLVSSILTKMETQDKITRITKEALEAPGKNKGITAIETRRILDYISRTLSTHILSITKTSTEPELHRLVYGLAQIAAEVSIVSALKDITYATSLSKKQSVDLSLRKKRSVTEKPEVKTTTTTPALKPASIYSAILNKTISPPPKLVKKAVVTAPSPYSVIGPDQKKTVHIINTKPIAVSNNRGFLNQTALDIENARIIRSNNMTDTIMLDKKLNETGRVKTDTLDSQETSAPDLIDDWLDPKEKSTLNTDALGELEIDGGLEEPSQSEKIMKQKLERLELKAKKAILYAGDLAYLTAASVVAMRRALTASIEVYMSVRYAKTGMSNHQGLMMNLAKTAAQQAGKEARTASSKSLACERVIKLAVKYTAQSFGANLNHVANRIIMDNLSLSTLAKSMAFVSSDIAIKSLYQATDVKPPS